MPAFRNLTGQTFGRLEVVERAAKIRGRTAWKCRCICGASKDVTGSDLVTGNTQSCGCLFLDAVTTHGQYLDPVNAVWRQMNARCSNPNNQRWERYGGRGIVVCGRWKNSYLNFLADMGPRPEGATLERRQNDGPYAPENCYWATYTEQNRNTSQNRMVTLGNITKTVIEWCELTGINHAVLRSRLDQGWDVELALTTPQNPLLRKDRPRPHLRSTLTFNGETLTIKEWGARIGIKPEVIAMRVSREWSLADALSPTLRRTHPHRSD